MFLFKDGLLTLMYRASLSVLSYHYTEVVNGDTVTRDDRMVMDRGRGLEMFFEPLCKISC